ncbi:hypothetical protein EON73_00615 [bacterium]|nr:MAG: hypothetical protein EON73_00615 [bacterium]
MVVQNRRLSKTEGHPRRLSPKVLEGTKGYQSKALDRKTSCKPLVCKPYKAKLCMAAKLLAEGGKTSRRRRQNFVLQAIQSLQSWYKAYRADTKLTKLVPAL